MIRLSRSINTIFANNTNDWYVEGSHVVTHSLFDGSFPFGVTGNNNITGDPQFVDAANDDYRLQSTSSAINVGDNTVSGLPNEDLDGNPRFFDSTVDIGAYEHGNASVNDSPVAGAQAVSTGEDTAIQIMLSGSDVDGDSLTYNIVDSPWHGTLSGIAPDLTYTPEEGYSGEDSFTYTANDGELDSELATVSITVISRVMMPTGLDILEYLSSNQLQSSFPFTWLQEIEPADVGALNLYVRLIADGLEADNLTVDISNLTAQESIEKALAMNQPSLQEGVDYIFVLEAVNKQETQTELVDVVVYDDGYT